MSRPPTPTELAAFIEALPQATWYIRFKDEEIWISATGRPDFVLPLSYVGAVEGGLRGQYRDDFVSAGVILPPEHTEGLVHELTCILGHERAHDPW